MPYKFTSEEIDSYLRAKNEVDLNPRGTVGLCVVDYGADWHKAPLAHLDERYGVRDSRHVKIYNLIPVYGDWIRGDKQWVSPVGNEDDFGRDIVDTVMDGATKHGPWALMSPESFKLETSHGGTMLGIGIGQAYRLRPDGVWINYEAGKTHKEAK